MVDSKDPTLVPQHGPFAILMIGFVCLSSEFFRVRLELNLYLCIAEHTGG